MIVKIDIDTEKIPGFETYERGANKAVGAILVMLASRIEKHMHFSPGMYQPITIINGGKSIQVGNLDVTKNEGK